MRTDHPPTTAASEPRRRFASAGIGASGAAASAAREQLVTAIAAAIHEWRFIPDAGDGHPSIRSGSDRDLAELAVKVAQQEGWVRA